MLYLESWIHSCSDGIRNNNCFTSLRTFSKRKIEANHVTVISVSLTSAVYKVLERIVKDNIVDHLNEYDIIKDSQQDLSDVVRDWLVIQEAYQGIDEGNL